jgi:two-component system NarL family sensor kinase
LLKRIEDGAYGDLAAALFDDGVIGRANSPFPPFVESFEQMTALLPEQVALLDENWDVVTANTPWITAARMLGHSGLEIGGNYKRFCIEKATEGYLPAIRVLEGIVRLDSGPENSFRFVQEGVGPLEGSIFQICLRRTRVQDRSFTVATRIDITELRGLRDMRKEFGELLMESRADERRRLARELHDSTMQQLLCLRLGIGQLKRSPAPKQADQVLDEMDVILGNALSELRTISYLAHPPLLDEVGLHQALQLLVDGFMRRSGLHTTLDWRGEASTEDHLAEIAIYRIVQEALSNVHRHSGGHAVTVRVTIRSEMIEARITDDGVGMPRRPSGGVGLAGMRARLEELGGQLKLRSNNYGTEIIATVPRAAVDTGTGFPSADFPAPDGGNGSTLTEQIAC